MSSTSAPVPAPDADPRRNVRERIVAAAAELLHEDGADAVTTRAVAVRAGVQAPTIYRLFGDKDGLLDAVAEHAMTVFAAEKAALVADGAAEGTDPVAALRSGWDATIAFGLANPDLFVIMSDPRRGRGSPAVAAGLRALEERLRRVAAVGRLLVREADAVRLVHAAGTGTVLAILEEAGEAEDDRRSDLADRAWAAVASQVLVAEDDVPAGPDRALRTAALTLRAGVDGLDALSPAERAVLAEWLDRVVDGTDGGADASDGGA
ncbi:TetR/AcrR family transcriptional regulator [Curtobacterium sp. RHCKG23]|uniref:TetR/AcrR family transcriptional regulator n=1 Tax=Curtobacterium citri TaxID=3055139 RepID=A0ABT7T1W1_9MICO|nr:TetR/AcrR family transcriptional regulator [Curtobacterium citri]MDM7883563.1 TetR/AcrR family transcriptional regulator [Curtobacterium citri]